METIVVKFGGSSLASAGQIRKAAAILQQNPDRRYLVVSAPGKRDGSDTKVTDLLYRCYDSAVAGTDFDPVLQQISRRYGEIAEELGVSFDIESEIAVIRSSLAVPQRDYIASRGEYLNAKLIAAYLGRPFVDSADTVCFRENGSFDPEATDAALSAALLPLKSAVIPGFYGSDRQGNIHTFSRGGSDVTGALVARAVSADIYENWTDVSGMLSADPRIVENPQAIACITYRELRELSYMGASVMHEDAVFPVLEKGIPINIRNTNRPEDPGTMILSSLPEGYPGTRVTGIAGKTGFTGILLEKSMMNDELGFGLRLMEILVKHGLSFEHCPTGIDTMSVIVPTDRFEPVRKALMDEISLILQPDLAAVEDDLALIAVVGEGMIYSKGTAACVFRAISDAGVNIRMIDQGSSERSIIIGVKAADYEAALNSIYHAVFDPEEHI